MKKVYYRGPFVFSVGLLLFFLYILVTSFQYHAEVRLFPLLVSVLGLTLSLFILVGEFFPKMLQMLEVSLEAMWGKRIPRMAETESTVERWGAALKVLGWMSFFFISIYLFGLVTSFPVFLFFFLLTQAKLGWIKALIISIVSGGIFYAVLTLGFEAFVWRGVIPELIPGILGGDTAPPL